MTKGKVKSSSDIVSTGVKGLDDVLGGGIPQGHAMLLVGKPGTGKSILSMEYLLHGIELHKENGVYISFEESEKQIISNAASFGWKFEEMVKKNKLAISYIDMQPEQMRTVGDYDLSALILRVKGAIKKVNARRVVIDGINNLLSTFDDERIIRSDLLRLIREIKEVNATIFITGERGHDSWSKMGFEEYLADGLMHLDNRTDGNYQTREIQVVKCRGINHYTGKSPFIINSEGMSIRPLITADFDYKVLKSRVSTGIADIDNMLGGKGLYRGSTVYITGPSGAGKTSISSSFANGACSRGERALFLAFEESSDQIIRNMKSIGLSLDKWVNEKLLYFYTARATTNSLEGHLDNIMTMVREVEPTCVVLDPISAFRPIANENETKLMLIRLNDYLRARKITTVFTALSSDGEYSEHADVQLSSIADTWIVVRIMDYKGERNNVMQLMKSRGMSHSRQMKEMYFTGNGLKLQNVYQGPEGVLTGAARIGQEKYEKLKEARNVIEIDKNRKKIERKKSLLEASIEALKHEYEEELEALHAAIEEAEEQNSKIKETRKEIENIESIQSGEG